MLDTIVFAFGGFVFVLFFAGLIFTIKEMHIMGKNPENYTPEPWFTKPKERVTED
jgi:quinol-cytochrome oxidoreductase complex cytochrome b subunit